MRRLVLELPLVSSRSRRSTIYGTISSIQLLHRLRESGKEIDAICRIEFKNADGEPSDLLSWGSITDVQPLYQEKDGSFIVYLRTRGKPFKWLMSILGPIERKSGVYMYGLFGLQEGKLKLSYLGNKRQVKDFLKRLQAAKVRHSILSLTDARFSPDSPLYSLTEKQRRILIAAFKLGYFEIPRRLSFTKLSQLLGLGRTTVNEHLRKAEARLISVLLSEQSQQTNSAQRQSQFLLTS